MSLAHLALGDQTDDRLIALFDRLQVTSSETEAAAITNLVWAIWHESDNETVNAFMSKGVEEMSSRNFEAAVSSFNKVIEVDPDFAEGWNKRATVYYLIDEYQASISDIAIEK